MNKITFDQAIIKLEEIVAKMEQGDLSLEQTLDLYEQGTKLASFCHETLSSAKLKIQEIDINNEKSGE